jgi:hypothetical protein
VKLNLVGHLVLERIRKKKSAVFLSFFSENYREAFFKGKNQKSFVSLAVERETQTERDRETR